MCDAPSADAPLHSPAFAVPSRRQVPFPGMHDIVAWLAVHLDLDGAPLVVTEWSARRVDQYVPVAQLIDDAGELLAQTADSRVEPRRSAGLFREARKTS